MPGPSVIFSFILATLYGAVFHLVSGARAPPGPVLLAAWLGFALGHLVGDLVDLTLLDIGPLHVLPATVGAWLALVVARLLTRQPSRPGAR